MVYTPSGGSAVTTDYALDGTNVVREFQSGVVTATYLMGASGPMYRRPVNSSDVRWYVYDGLGSVVGEVSVTGTMVGSKKHDVYGLTRSTSGSPASKHGWVGQLGHTSDEETGLVYMRARHYDPVIGRFVSEDPARDGDNWFGYCSGNPVNKVDETGCNTLAIALGLGIIGFLAGFFSSIQSDINYGNEINWGNAFAQGGIWGLAGVAGGLLAVPIATVIPILIAVARVALILGGAAVISGFGKHFGEIYGALQSDADPCPYYESRNLAPTQ
jgi:RHS repeat-associated protein